MAQVVQIAAEAAAVTRTAGIIEKTGTRITMTTTTTTTFMVTTVTITTKNDHGDSAAAAAADVSSNSNSKEAAAAAGAAAPTGVNDPADPREGHRHQPAATNPRTTGAPAGHRPEGNVPTITKTKPLRKPMMKTN